MSFDAPTKMNEELKKWIERYEENSEYTAEDRQYPFDHEIERACFCLDILQKNGYQPYINIDICGLITFNFDKKYILMQTQEQENTNCWTLVCFNKHYSYDLNKQNEIDELIKTMNERSFFEDGITPQVRLVWI